MGDSFNVTPDKIKDFSQFLKGNVPGLTADLQALKTEMDNLDASAWTDYGGQAFKAQFDAFITDALTLNQRLEHHADFTLKFATNTQEAESTYAAQIK